MSLFFSLLVAPSRQMPASQNFRKHNLQWIHSLFQLLFCTFCSKFPLQRSKTAPHQTPGTLLTISTFCYHLRPARLQALPQFTLLFSQSVPICRHFNCLTLADLTLLPGRHTVTLNDDKREDGDQTERVSERRDERSEGRTGIWQPCEGGKKGEAE